MNNNRSNPAHLPVAGPAIDGGLPSTHHRERARPMRSCTTGMLPASSDAVGEIERLGRENATLPPTLKLAAWAIAERVGSGATESSVRRILRQAGIPMMPQSERARRYLLNERAFDPDPVSNPECAYWLGFLMADGYVRAETGLVTVGLQEADAPHLKLLRQFFGTDAPVKIYRSNYKDRRWCRLQVFSRRLMIRLGELGMPIGSKHGVAVPPPPGLRSSVHFWRGFFDGDGGLSIRPNASTSRARPDLPKATMTTASPAMMESFVDFIVRAVNPGSRTKAQVYKGRRGGHLSINLGSHTTVQLARVLYFGPDGEPYAPALLRKLRIAASVKDMELAASARKLPPATVAEMRRRHSEGASRRDLCVETGMSRSRMSDLLSGRSYRKA